MSAILGAVERDLPDAAELRTLNEIRREVVEADSFPDDVAGPLRVMRYLRARLGNKAEATEMFRKMLQWRVAEQRLKVSDVRASIVGLSLDEFQRRYAAKPERKYLPSAFLGRSRRGALVAWYKVGMWDLDGISEKFGDDAMVKHEVEKMEWVMHFFYEVAMKERKVPYLFVIADLEGASARFLKGKSRQQIMDMIKNLTVCYIDAVEVTIVVNASWLFRTAYAMISPLMSERQKAKVRVFGDITDKSHLEALHATISPELLPHAFGGTADPDLYGDYAQAAMRDGCARVRSSDEHQASTANENNFGASLFSCCVNRGPPSPSVRDLQQRAKAASKLKGPDEKRRDANLGSAHPNSRSVFFWSASFLMFVAAFVAYTFLDWKPVG